MELSQTDIVMIRKKFEPRLLQRIARTVAPGIINYEVPRQILPKILHDAFEFNRNPAGEYLKRFKNNPISFVSRYVIQNRDKVKYEIQHYLRTGELIDGSNAKSSRELS